MNIVPSKTNNRRAGGVGTLLLGLLMLGACSEEPAMEQPAPESEVVRLDFTAGIMADAVPSTRATIDGSVFPPRNDAYLFGMWVCKHEDDPSAFIPAMNDYENMRVALYAVTTDEGEYQQQWKYTFDDKPHNVLHVKQHTPVDIYAYYPRTQVAGDQSALKPTAVPFQSGSSDWMWAEPLQFTCEQLSGASVDVPLAFSHAMTCLEIRMKCLYTGSVDLTSITLTDKKRRIYTSGSMNLVNRTLILSDENKSETLTIKPGTRLQPTDLKFHIIMPPVAGYEDGDFTLSFVFNGKPAETTFPIPNRMRNLSGEGEVTVSEFETGKRYIYSLTLDNTLRFTPVGVDNTWETVEFELEL